MDCIGFVNNIQRKDAKQVLTVVLNYQELQKHNLVLGEFIVVRASGIRKYLARVESCYYAPVLTTGEDNNKALATGRLNSEVDGSSVKRINFMHYDLAVLGEMSAMGNQFFAGMREIPSLMDVEVYRPDKTELQQIVNAKVTSGDGIEELVSLGVLQYGTRQGGNNAPALPPHHIDISFNIANLHPKRTAVFGKTGYGKSNLIKTLITQAHLASPTIAQLIFDVNGEYAFTNKQGKGLIDVFAEGKKQAKIVVYSNRTDAQEQYGKDIVKPIKFDVIENPEMAVALVVGKRQQRGRSDADYLDTLKDPDMHSTVRAFWKCFCVEELGLAAGPQHKAGYNAPTSYVKENDLSAPHIIDDFSLARSIMLTKKYCDSDTVKNLTGKTGQFSFLKRFHYLGGANDSTNNQNSGVSNQSAPDFFASLKGDISHGKIVVLDLPSLDSNLLTPLSDRVAAMIFDQAQNNFLINSVKGTKPTADLLMYVEEAHNVLSDEQNTIFPRIAREGRKYGIGLVYSTQRPGSIDEDILTQSENFFVMHMGSEEDVTRLRKAKIAFASPISDFILTEPAIGVAYIYSEPYQPYVLSCRIKKFEDVLQSALL